MSVRERPVASRYLDMKEKELKYRQHVRTLRTCKAQIDTKEVEMAPRFKLAARNQAIFREKLKQRDAMHTRMIEDARRPKTATTFSDRDELPLFPPRRRQQYYNDSNDMDVFRQEYELSRPKTGKPHQARRQQYYMSDSIESPSVSSSPMPMDSDSQASIHELRTPQRQQENIRIGTVEQKDSSKVLIITDKENSKEPPSMVILPSENPSDTSSTNSDSSSDHEKPESTLSSYQKQNIDPEHLLSSSTDVMDSSAGPTKDDHDDTQRRNMSIRKVIDNTLYNDTH